MMKASQDRLGSDDADALNCSMAALDRRHHLQLVEADVTGVGRAPRRSVATEDIRDLQLRTGHGCRRLRLRLLRAARLFAFLWSLPNLGPMLQATRTIPIVFTIVPDPVGSGFVDSLARPGGNATGFMQFEYNLSGKWLELLKEIAPGVRRAAVLRDAAQVSGIGQFAVIQSVAPQVGADASPVNLRGRDRDRA